MWYLIHTYLSEGFTTFLFHCIILATLVNNQRFLKKKKMKVWRLNRMSSATWQLHTVTQIWLFDMWFIHGPFLQQRLDALDLSDSPRINFLSGHPKIKKVRWSIVIQWMQPSKNKSNVIVPDWVYVRGQLKIRMSAAHCSNLKSNCSWSVWVIHNPEKSSKLSVSLYLDISSRDSEYFSRCFSSSQKEK